jgi:hypothetical protein
MNAVPGQHVTQHFVRARLGYPDDGPSRLSTSLVRHARTLVRHASFRRPRPLPASSARSRNLRSEQNAWQFRQTGQ